MKLQRIHIQNIACTFHHSFTKTPINKNRSEIYVQEKAYRSGSMCRKKVDRDTQLQHVQTCNWIALSKYIFTLTQCCRSYYACRKCTLVEAYKRFKLYVYHTNLKRRKHVNVHKMQMTFHVTNECVRTAKVCLVTLVTKPNVTSSVELNSCFSRS